MTAPSASSPQEPTAMVWLSCDALHALRAALFRDLGADGAQYLQEAGYAGGGAVTDAFARWLDERGLGSPEALPAADFAQHAADFFRDAGWGSLELGALGGAIAVVDSSDWAEADPESGMAFPGCYVTSGMLADFFGRLAGAPLAAMEVECRSMGAERCRFLLGSAEILQRVYDGMAVGIGYEETVAGMEP